MTELERKAAELDRIEGAQAAALARVEALEDSIRVLGFERAIEWETTSLKEARFDEWIWGLERDVSSLGDQIVALKAERARMLDLTPLASVPRHFYKKWIHAEAQRDIYIRACWQREMFRKPLLKKSVSKHVRPDLPAATTP